MSHMFKMQVSCKNCIDKNTVCIFFENIDSLEDL